jgi:hypothetical protein
MAESVSVLICTFSFICIKILINIGLTGTKKRLCASIFCRIYLVAISIYTILKIVLRTIVEQFLRRVYNTYMPNSRD